MKLSTTITFLVLFVLVAAFYFLLDPQKKATQPGQGETSMRLLDVEDGDAIREIQIVRASQDERVRLEKHDQTWYVLSPVRAHADQLLVKGLVTALKLSTKARRLLREKDWAEYGLEKPSIKVVIKTEKNKEPRTLLLGDQSPVGEFVYARWEDETDYFLLNADLKKAFDRSAYSLREKRIFRTPSQALSKIYIQTPFGRYDMARVDEGWYWVEPAALLGEPVDKRDVDFVIASVRDFYVKDFMDEKQAGPEPTRFSEWGSLVRLKSDSLDQETLFLGDELPARDAYYALKEGNTGLFVISRTNIHNFFKRMDELSREYRVRISQSVPQLSR